jgi:phenol 2-monooxygenase (NADPH)
LIKTFVDDESYNSGHGHAYKAYGIDPEHGAVVVVRPDHCMSLVFPETDSPTTDGC